MKCKMCRFEVDPETGKCPLGHVDKGPAHAHSTSEARTSNKRRKPRLGAIAIGGVVALALAYVLAIPGFLIHKNQGTAGLESIPVAQRSLAARRQALVTSCETALGGMKPAVQPTSRLDPVLTVANLKLVSLPIHLRNAPTPVARTLYQSANEYIGNSTIPDVQLWQAFMKRDGFRGGAAVDYSAGPDHWNVVALRFASPAKAADFQRSTIDAFCSNGVIRGLKQIPTLPGSFTLTRLDPTSPYRASLLVGSSVIHLNICSCVETKDPIGVVSKWAVTVGVQFGLTRKPDAALNA